MTTDDAITRARQALLPLLRDACTITHTPPTSSGGAQSRGTPTSITTVANVQRSMGEAAQAVADQLSVVNPAIVRLPIGTVVVAADVITVAGSTFVVVVPLSETMNLTLHVLCREVTG